MKKYLAIIGLWVLAQLAVFVLPHPYPALVGFGPLYFPLLGLLLILLFALGLLIERRKWLPLLAMVAVGGGSVLTFEKGVSWGAAAHFYLNRAGYEATLEKVMAAPDEAAKARACGDCLVLSAKDNRVGFHYAHAFLSWHDIVYDPSGAVAAAGFDEKRRVNTYLRSAERITGHWYVVHFAD
jgi:hypothetical protein